MGRRGGVEFLKKAAAEIFLNSVIAQREDVRVDRRTEEGRAFHLKMEEMQVTLDWRGGISVYYISSTNLTSLDDVIDLGLNPQDLSMEELH